MIYPKFIKKGGTVGICAPSAGVGRKLDKYLESLNVIKKEGYKVKETKHVRVNNQRSCNAKQRAKEIDELFLDKNVDIVTCATGGDYMFEIMPYINFEHIKENPKWIFGLSDPTNLLYTVTTKLDIASVYGHNSSGYVESKCKRDNLSIMKGEIPIQKSYKKYLDFVDKCNNVTIPSKKVKWVSANNITFKGRAIGGCLDVIRNIIGTEYDYTLGFLERHKEDGFIWYFDVFSMTPLDFYLTLLQFKYAGYFDYCNGVCIGRIAFPNIEDPKFDYLKAADLALGKIPHICEMDIGHTDPGMSIINGAMMKVTYKDGKGSIKFDLI